MCVFGDNITVTEFYVFVLLTVISIIAVKLCVQVKVDERFAKITSPFTPSTYSPSLFWQFLF